MRSKIGAKRRTPVSPNTHLEQEVDRLARIIAQKQIDTFIDTMNGLQHIKEQAAKGNEGAQAALDNFTALILELE